MAWKWVDDPYRVRVIDPQVFIRCGYPLWGPDIAKTIDESALVGFLKSVGMSSVSLLDDRSAQLIEKVKQEIGYAIAKSKNFGGKERRIYTEEREELLGVAGDVYRERVVCEGTYEPGGYGHSGWGEPDYWPPSFSMRRRVKVLDVMDCMGRDFQIEASRVERVE